LAKIEHQLQERLEAVKRLASQRRLVTTPAEIEAFEQEVGQATDALAGAIVGLTIQLSVATPQAQTQAAELAKATSRTMKHQGWREVAVRTTRGGEVRIRTPYWSGKKTGRAKRATGLYASLALLGIWDHCTPALAACVAQMAVVCSSFEEATLVLAERGLEL